jgi:glycosyltransferase involved in cell wall biosynthesis
MISSESTSETPEVSVVIAAYNSESTIREAIDSVLSQTLAKWEIVVVDDASTDATGAILDEFAGDERFQIIRNSSNLGSGRSRNIAFAAAKGEFVAVLDADDLMLPERLRLQLEKFKGDPALDALGSQLAEFGTWGGPVVSSWPVTEAEIQKRIRKRKMPIAHCAAMFRKEAVLNVGGYDEACRRAQDYALMLRLSGSRVLALPEVLTMYRTTRPLPLSYAIKNGRYVQLAKRRLRLSGSSQPTDISGLPHTAFVDARSMVTWARRRLNER